MAYREIARYALIAAALLQGCGGGSGPSEPGGSATVQGVVQDDATKAPLAGATVRAGSVNTTSGADGRFELSNVPAGSVTIEAQATGFQPHSAMLEVREGVTTHDIRLLRRSLFEPQDFAVYVPPAVPALRGAIVFIQGTNGVDTRGYANDEFNYPDPAINASQRQLRQSLLSLATKYGLAIVGMAPLADGPTTYGRVIGTLEQVALQSAWPELGQVPLLPVGVSAGGRPAYGITLWRPERMIGFMAIIPVAPSTDRSAAAQQVPGYVLVGEKDTQVGTESQIGFFEANRAEGALWALAIEPGAGHTALSEAARSVMVQWMDEILELRLPAPGASGGLRPLEESAGWLGNRTTFEVAAYADYVGEPRQASWLPTAEVAQSWKSFVSPGGGKPD